ncbi:MFS transporter [Streptomyces sp. NPDC002809]|uniref:MFS transporter n=1 Tax=Streptomyces sp. NPDC002809 TaxID=3154433 RepID=UPI00332EDE50
MTGLWTRDFLLFFVARFASLLGDVMLPVAITAAVIESGYGAEGVGYALAAQVAPFAALLILGGVLSDRFGARRLMVIADAARLVCQGALALLFLTGRPELWQILALMALTGAGGAVFQPGVASVTPRIARDVQKANATLGVAQSVTTVVGPSLAGLLLAFASPGWVVACDGATFAVSGVCLLMVRSVSMAGAGGGAAKSFRLDLVEGWHEFRARTWLWSVIVLWMVLQLSSWGPTLTLGYSTLVTDHGASVFGLIMSAFGVGNVLGGLVALRLRPEYPLRAATLAVSVYVLMPPAVAFGLSASLVAVCFAIGGAGLAFWSVMFHTSVQTLIPQHVLGRVHAYDAAGSLVMLPVGQAIAAPVAVVLGTVPVLVTAAGMGLVVCALLLAVPAVRDLRRADG